MKAAVSDARFADNGKIKLMIIVGTRPEIIKLSAVIAKCREYFDTLLVHTGQNYDYNLCDIFFRDLGLSAPDIWLGVAGEDVGETMGNVIARSYKLMAQLRPQAVLMLGDTNSCLSALSAKRLHVPIFHMEAGNRCKDECLPEENIRRVVDAISDINMPYGEHARAYLHECGLPKERIYATGSPMAEVLSANLPQILASDVHQRLGLEKGRYLLLSAHREENIDDDRNFFSLFGAVNALAQAYDLPVMYSCHPRSRKRLDAYGFVLDQRVRVLEPLGFHDYNCLQINAKAVVTDSGTLAEESAFFACAGHPFAAVSIRTSTERPEAVDAGHLILAGITAQSLLQAVATTLKLHDGPHRPCPVAAYSCECVSDKVVRIIQSYTHLIPRLIYRSDCSE